MAWRDIPDLDGRYEANEDGVIRNADTKQPRRSRIDRFGYVRLSIRKNGKYSYQSIHRLVMSAFVGRCPVGYEVNHIDGVKTNNHLSNLEYVTRSENTKHAYKLGLKRTNYPSYRGSEHACAILNDADVMAIRSLHGVRRNVDLAREFHVSVSTIEAIVYRRNWKHLD